MLQKGLCAPRAATLLAGFLWMGCSCGWAAPTHLERYHKILTEFLRTYVVTESVYKDGKEFVSSRVRYGALKRDERWSSYTASLAQVDRVYLRTASLEDRIAFWINTYNALVIDTVIRHYPIAPSAAYPYPSIRSIRGAWEMPHTVAGQTYTLEDIEKLLAGLGDGRVWFLTCPAAKGGPNLRPYALTPTNISQELESACGGYCNDTRHVRIDEGTNQLQVSEYLQDKIQSLADPVRAYLTGVEKYPPSERPLIDTLLRRFPAEKKEYIRAKRPEIVFVPFDWSLNDAP